MEADFGIIHIGNDGNKCKDPACNVCNDDNGWVIKQKSEAPPCPGCGTILKLNGFDRRYECPCGLTYYKPLSGIMGLRQGWYNGLKEAGGN